MIARRPLADLVRYGTSAPAPMSEEEPVLRLTPREVAQIERALVEGKTTMIERRASANRRQAGPLVVSVAAFLLGLSAGQLWARHMAGWYLFLGGMLLLGLRGFL